jgi:hypothetical protein
MEEVYERMMLSATLGLSPFDWLTVVSLFAVATFLVVAPVLGYVPTNRLAHLALWALVAKMGLTLCRIIVVFYTLLGGVTRLTRPGQFNSPGLQEPTSWPTLAAQAILPPLEAGLFVLAMLLFVLWLTGLRRRQYPNPP